MGDARETVKELADNHFDAVFLIHSRRRPPGDVAGAFLCRDI